MKIFIVLEPPDGRPERVVFVPEGFSWLALLFTSLWALWHRMWVVAALLFVLFTALTIAVDLGLLRSDVALVLQIGLSVLFGFEARVLRVRALESAGYRRAGLIQASGREAAEFAYFAGRAPAVPALAASRIQPVQHDTLGLFGNV